MPAIAIGLSDMEIRYEGLRRDEGRGRVSARRTGRICLADRASSTSMRREM